MLIIMKKLLIKKSLLLEFQIITQMPLLLNILEMRENDLIETANNITDSYSNNKFENYEKFLVNYFEKNQMNSIL